MEQPVMSWHSMNRNGTQKVRGSNPLSSTKRNAVLNGRVLRSALGVAGAYLRVDVAQCGARCCVA
jgi:hypothetical protein